MIFDDSEPPWFDRKIKNLIKYKNEIYKDKTDHKSNHNYTVDILKISLTEKSIKLKAKAAKKCHSSTLKNISLF